MIVSKRKPIITIVRVNQIGDGVDHIKEKFALKLYFQNDS